MKSRHILVAAGSVIALSAAATGAFAAGSSVQATAGATLTVLTADSLTKIQDLSFGTVVKPTTTTTTFTLNPSTGAVTASGGDGFVAPGATTQAAKFTFVAPAGTQITTAATLNFTQSGLNNVTATATPSSLTMAGATQEVDVGGSFDVTTGTTAQAYTGSLTLTVTYQ